jgi:hypothetical protein
MPLIPYQQSLSRVCTCSIGESRWITPWEYGGGWSLTCRPEGQCCRDQPLVQRCAEPAIARPVRNYKAACNPKVYCKVCKIYYLVIWGYSFRVLGYSSNFKQKICTYKICIWIQYFLLHVLAFDRHREAITPIIKTWYDTLFTTCKKQMHNIFNT